MTKNSIEIQDVIARYRINGKVFFVRVSKAKFPMKANRFVRRLFAINICPSMNGIHKIDKCNCNKPKTKKMKWRKTIEPNINNGKKQLQDEITLNICSNRTE